MTSWSCSSPMKAPVTKRAILHALGAAHLPVSDGRQRRRVDLPADPIQHEPTTSGPVRLRRRSRRSGCCSTTAPGPRRPAARHPRRPLSALRTVVLRRSRSPARSRAPGTSGPEARSVNRRRLRRGRLLRLERRRAPADRLPGQHRHGRAVGQRLRVAMELGARTRPDSAVSYLSAPLTANTTVIGAGAVHLWVNPPRRTSIFQATVSEVRPDGNETFVQNGWIRASERKLATTVDNMFAPAEHAAGALLDASAPSDLSAMPGDQFVKVDDSALLRGARLPGRLADQGDDLGAQRHPAGLVLQPDRSRKARPPKCRSHSGPSIPASLILPVVPGVSVPAGVAALPEPAQRAMPHLPALRQQRILTAGTGESRPA